MPRTPAPVTFDDAQGTFTIPASPGVEYLVLGEVCPPDTYYWYATRHLTVSARALPGETLSGTSSWSHVFPDLGQDRPFLDVAPGMQHADHITWMAESGISTGWATPEGREYRPLELVNRDAMAAFLHRLAGSPAVTLPPASPFSDMRAGQEHYAAVIWAHQQGITTGWRMPGGRLEFRPIQPIARDAMAAFLHRFSGDPAPARPATPCFTDVPTSSQFAGEICWMKQQGLATGWPDGSYRPLAGTARDAMAAFLHRFSER